MAYRHAVLGESEEATKSAIEWGLNSNSTEKKINIIKNNIKEKITPLIMKGKENNGIMREKQ